MVTWPNLKFPPINLLSVWPRPDQWYRITDDEDWWLE